ncbi:hypothetical protein QLQ12_36455 [Actinoplanes sp. NEAU-A12]|uniref:Integral membrane protein n=1 Tax=Actinoplanes sandaracinus TaxID=3045177 RepID=A0ABT6WWH2_9ACTN|nr:hypothetical protein [Actinoplanes sandaracinus]MDI6104098.1 hypothetical protein [Actinoplanes sandaracinus]
MAALYLVLVLVALGWPLVAVGACALVILALARLAGGQGASPASGRWEWPLSAGMAMAAIASYGYGLARTTSLLMTDAEDRCVIASRTAVGYEHPVSSVGATSLWPLHDTTCGPDLVPAFVNPLVVTLALLCLTLVVVTAAARVRRAGDVAGHLRA